MPPGLFRMPSQRPETRTSAMEVWAKRLSMPSARLIRQKFARIFVPMQFGERHSETAVASISARSNSASVL